MGQRHCCNQYKAIFMDINMPVMDGEEATETLKAMMQNKELPLTPIFAVTAARCESPRARRTFIERGFDDVCMSLVSCVGEKPVTLAKLRKLIQNVQVYLQPAASPKR